MTSTSWVVSCTFLSPYLLFTRTPHCYTRKKKKMIIMVVDFTIFPSPFLCVNLGRRWIGEADRHDFEGMLTRDIIQQAYGIPNFDAK